MININPPAIAPADPPNPVVLANGNTKTSIGNKNISGQYVEETE